MSKRKRQQPLDIVISDLDDDDDTPIFNIQSISRDGRRVRSRAIPVAPPSPQKGSTSVLAPTPLKSLPLFYGDDNFELPDFFANTYDSVPDDEMDDLEGLNALDVNDRKKMARHGASSDGPMVEWKAFTSLFLDEMMVADGRGRHTSTRCFLCQRADREGEARYRCHYCYGGQLMCQECLLRVHQSRPLDRVEYWNGLYFEPTTLGALGLVIQLAHPAGESCSLPEPFRTGFTVVDVFGIQDVNLCSCLCQPQDIAGNRLQQMLRFKFYPATVHTPQTAFTFRLLNLFHTMTLQGKVTLYDFYRSIEKRTDGTGTVKVKDRYDAFVRVVRQWRYLKQLRRRGLGNVVGRDLQNLKPGSLAIRCIACPRPGINLPNNWREAAKEWKFLYQKFIAVDACFRLKRRAVSSEQKDPGLNTGLSYFVPQAQYQEFAKRAPEQDEKSSCPGLMAIDQANTKFAKGYAQTGAILCLCARHEMIEPNGTVDTNKGEKFCLTDYAIASSQRLSDEFLDRVLSYDICCQYCRHFASRMKDLPEEIRLHINPEKWQFVVPKLHITGHNRECQENFAFHLLPGSGQTDGEGVERHWASIGPIASSSKEMGPGHRRETIDDHLGFWCHLKIIALGELLRKRRQRAREKSQVHAEEFKGFSQSQKESTLQSWRQIVMVYEGGRTVPGKVGRYDEDGKLITNPYSNPSKGKSEHDVRLEYAMKEAKDEMDGVPPIHDISPSAFMETGLAVEEQQRLLVMDLSKDKNVSTIHQVELVERRARLLRLVSRLRTLQQVYTPHAIAALNAPSKPTSDQPLGSPDSGAAPTNSNVGSNKDDVAFDIVKLTKAASKGNVEAAPLYLPSGLPEQVRSLPEMGKWVQMEASFRRGQLQSALDGLRSHLFIRTRLNLQRTLHVRHQHAAVRARQVMARNDHKIDVFKAKYCSAWAALKTLVGEESIGLPQLHKADVSSYDEVDTHALRNVRKVLGTQRRNGTVSEAGSRIPKDALVKPGESVKRLSWIWTTYDVSTDSDELQQVMRIEWSKSWARKRRWAEELALVEEEMRRALITLKYEAAEWKCRAAVEGELESTLKEGMNAFAYQQAAIRDALASNFEALWAKPDPPPKVDVCVADISDGELEAESEEEDSEEGDDDEDVYDE
ncbi:hypothetical protein V5O48_014022 [Marasmius crinis-equi]|uniref:CxC2-like cysteine cluster KDZ transposase-associated domain-containing protein n=1 Tax=Marasmius crinis-equi TaxID=585013 RepID=A0ABR3EYH3_9AGAR